MLSITIDKKNITNINKFIQRYPNLVDKALNVASSYGKKEIIKDTPVRTGQARRNYFNKRTGKLEYTIGNRKKYVSYLETGTRDRINTKTIIIKPKPPKKFLRFTVDGNVVFAKQAKIPKPFPKIIKNTLKGFVSKKKIKGIKAIHQYSKNIGNITKKLTSTLGLYIKDAWGKI